MTRAAVPQEFEPVVAEAEAAEEPVEKTYTVVGPHRVLDHEPGDEFKALLDPVQETRLIAAGQLAVKAGKSTKRTGAVKTTKEK